MSLLEFRTTSSRGRAVFAAQNIPAGTHLLVEEPLVSMPLPESKAAVIACERCCKPIGTITLQAQHLVSTDVSALPLYDEDDYLCGDVQCRNCCGARFCSAECEAALAPAHCYLCKGQGKAMAAKIDRFEAHAMEHEELFLFGARFVASALASGANSLEPFAALCRVPFWELDDEGVAKTNAEKREVKEACDESRKYLLALLAQGAEASEAGPRGGGKSTGDKAAGGKATACGKKKAVADSATWLSLEAWGGLLGAIRRNAILVELSHPLRDLLPMLREWACQTEGSREGEGVREMLEELPRPLPECLWSAVYPRISCLNHSCNHNAEVHFLDESHEGTVIARRSIRKGEEMCISYISDSESADVTQRRASLRDYGFTCDCQKCELEAEWQRRLRPRLR